VSSSGSLVVALAAARDAASAGGKGAALGELTRIGVAVPPGFAVTATAFAESMAALDPDGALRAGIEALPAGDLAAIGRVAAAFRARVAAAPLPAAVASAIESAYAEFAAAADVAVRSSATIEDSAEASFAGLQDTYLGIRGARSVLDHVRRCWASLYNDESVAYRRRLGMPEARVAMAVVVQQMVRPRAAGVMFTRSPVTGDRSVVAIEATWGLGSALVSGEVTPDSFVISKITSEITGRRVSAKGRLHSFIPNGLGVTVTDTPAAQREAACLTDDEIRALADAGRRVEAHYGTPQDIEWAILDEPMPAATWGAPAAPASSSAPAASAAEVSSSAPTASPAPGVPAAPAAEVSSRAPGASAAEVSSSAPAASAAEVSSSAPAASAAPGVPAAPNLPLAPAAERIVFLQSRPETVWAARSAAPVAAPKPRPADHVLALFGKPL
jgi:pyruvate, water dikinase